MRSQTDEAAKAYLTSGGSLKRSRFVRQCVEAGPVQGQHLSVIEQRFGAVVLPHHDQQASDNRNPAKHGL